MKRISVSISDELEESLDDYLQDQEVAPSLTAVLQAALKDYLADCGFPGPVPAFKVTLAS